MDIAHVQMSVSNSDQHQRIFWSLSPLDRVYRELLHCTQNTAKHVFLVQQALVKEWCLSSTDNCQCGQVKTTTHIVQECPIMKFSDGRLKQLYTLG